MQFLPSSCHSRVFTAPTTAPTGALAGTLRVIALLRLRLDCTCYTVSFPLCPQAEVRSVQFGTNPCHSRDLTAPLTAPTGALAGTLRALARPRLKPLCTCYTVSSPLCPQTAVRSVQFHPNACHTRVFTAPATALTGALTGTLPSLHPLRVRRVFTDCTSAFVEHKRKRPEGQSPLPDSGTG